MTAALLLRNALRTARQRRALDIAWRALPWLLAAATLALRLSGSATAIAVLLAGAVALVVVALYLARRLDTRWLVRELDAQRRDLEDSSDLLFASESSLTGLERLQRARLQQRLQASGAPDLRPRWSTRAIVVGAILATLVIAAIVSWPSRPQAAFDNVLAHVTGEAAAPTHTRMLEQRLQVTPPAYTRQPAREERGLDAKAPQGTRLQWMFRLAPQPTVAALVFHDGRRVALRRVGETWHGEHVLMKSALYRLELRDALPLREAKAHRLDAIADRPPQLRVLEPDRSLSLLTPGQRSWAVAFEASDDYGVAPSAQLRITLAQGSGENITFREQTMALHGRGSATVKRYAQRLELAALGLAAGDDLIVQLIVHDNRTPQPQSARSPSLILRWPSDLGTQTTGLEGMVKKVLPAYFRSQRQIIIDAEALLKQKKKLAGDHYLQRSDEIGVDQRLLRLRYGQFLGEESDGAPQPPPTNDAEDAHDESRAPDAPHDETAAPAHDDEHATPGRAPTFGEDAAVLEQYGHTHDHAEAATLLDPDTRTILKAALDQMWQSELNLRQGHPELALPYAYRALKHIKEVQQASRIYLARVGPELPPIDESRRLGGDRAGLGRRDDALVATTAADPTLATLWQALDEAPSAPRGTTVADFDAIDFTALERWLREHEARIADPLAFVTAIDALRNDPDCTPCRRHLRALLWPLLPRPAATVPRRGGGDASGRRYLDALRQEATQ
ncbi:hypothetical protein ACFOLC_13120 [Lysobacter cavernae]|uniref:DUF4175 domain-containing protein n=1 Tax=Lysobacter cavernae TaxID=1685901 RepID=A0ABV7RVD8_9GAMM